MRTKLFAGISIGLVMCRVTTLQAAIIPSWRVNPVPSAILPNAFCVSLMVELTGGSLFYVAGLNLNEVFARPSINFFNQATVGSDTRPNSALFQLFPELEFDTYVSTTSDSQPPVIPGLFGNSPDPVGTGGRFWVAWGATPNTGGIGPREIARITIIDGGPAIGLTSIPITAGLVTDSLNPQTSIPLPPIPTPAAFVPESGLVALVMPLVMIRRRWR